MRFTTLRNSTGEPLSLSSTSKAGERDTIIVPQESSLTSYLADSESSEPQKIPPWPRDLASSSPSVSPGSLNGDLGRNSSSSTRLHDERQFRLTSKTSDHNLQPRANSLPSPASSRVREFLNRPTPSSAPVDSFVAHTTPPTVVASAFDEAEARGIHDPTGNDIENLTPPPARPSAPTPGKEATPALRRRASLALAQALRDLEREMGLLQSDDDAVLTPYITQAHTSTHPSGGSGSGAEPYARRANASPVPRSERRVPGYVPGMHRPIPQRQSQQQQSASSDHAGFVGLIGTSNAQAPASPNVPPIVQSAGATSFGPIPAMPAPPLGPTSPQQDTRQIYIPPLSGTSAPRSTRKAARRTTDANALFQTSSYSTSPQTYRTRAPSRGPIARLPTSGNQQDTSGPPQRPNATLSPAAPAVQLRPTTRGTAITIRKPNGDIFFYTPASKLRPVSIDMPPSDSRLASLAPPPVSTTSYLGTTPETGEPPKMLAVGLESAKDRDGRLKAEDKQLQERTEKVVAAAQFKAKEDREARIAPPPSRLGELFRPPLSWRLAREAEEEQAAADAAPTAKAEEGADAAQTIPEQQIDNAIPIPGNYSKPESRAATALVGKESLITQVTTALPTSNGNMNRSSLSQPHSDGTMNTLAINGMASGHAKLKVSFPTYTGTEKAPPSKLILNVPKASPEHLKPSPAGSAAVGPPSLVRTPASTPKPTNTTTTYTSGVAVTTVNERPSLTAEDQKDGESIAAPALNLTEPVQYKTYYPPLLQRQPLQTVHDLTGENHTLRLLGLDGCSPYSLRGTEAAEAGTKLHSVRSCSASEIINGRAHLEIWLQFLRTCSSDPTIYTNTLKVLQDLCAASEELPSCYKLQSVVFDRRDVIGKGGEASIYSGNFIGQRVVLREVVMPRNYWRSPTGRNAIKVATSILIPWIIAHPLYFS